MSASNYSRAIDIVLPALPTIELTVKIRGMSPLIANKMSDKIRDKIAKKQTGESVAMRGAKNFEEDALGSRHLLADGTPAHPSSGFFLALLEAHSKGAPYTKKALEQGFRFATDLIPIQGKQVQRIDAAPNATGVMDLRARIQYNDWEADLPVVIYPDKLSVNQFIAALAAAGEYVGVGPRSMRKRQGFGRFKIVGVE